MAVSASIAARNKLTHYFNFSCEAKSPAAYAIPQFPLR